MKQVLFVEDDDTIAMGVENLLQISGYEVHHFTNAEDALAANAVWDIAVLDVMLPGMSGIDLLKELKKNSPNPIIMLTAKGTTRDIIQGLDNGADDYVTKPFQVGELLARIRARIRETTDNLLQSFRLGNIEIDLRKQVLRKNGEEVHLTTYEKLVLQYLIERKGQDIARQELLENVWGYSPTMQTRTVDNQILKLRKKIEDNHSKPKHIITVHGFGYRLEG
jgi:two-component system response regulator MtrA